MNERVLVLGEKVVRAGFVGTRDWRGERGRRCRLLEFVEQVIVLARNNGCGRLSWAEFGSQSRQAFNCEKLLALSLFCTTRRVEQ